MITLGSGLIVPGGRGDHQNEVVRPDGIRFPATQVPSSDANVLDDYEEGTWTPVLTFATEGDLDVAYSVQEGWYTKIGNTVRLGFAIVTSTFTHSTASGAVRVTGLPFTSTGVSGTTEQGTLIYQNIDKTSYTSFFPGLDEGTAIIRIDASGSGQSLAAVVAADMPTGNETILRGFVVYRT